MAPPKKFQDMPFDVYDYIFDIVRCDDLDRRKRTLFAASQTCKAWAAMTRRARFHSLSLIVKLPGEESIVKFFLQDFVQEPIFAKLVQDSCVKSLTLRWGRVPASSQVDFGAILPEYLPLFPGLHALQLCGVIYKRQDQLIAQRFNGVRSLTIYGGLTNYSAASLEYHDSRAICDLLCLFPTLQKLTLSGVHDWAPENAPPVPEDHPLMQIVMQMPPEMKRGVAKMLRKFPHGVLSAFVAAQAEGEGALEEEKDYDGAQGDLPTIRSVVMERSSCPRALASLLQSADVKFVDVTEEHGPDLRTVPACAATVEHVRCKLSYTAAGPNIDLPILHALRRLTLIIAFPAECKCDWLSICGLMESPWRTLASILGAAHLRPSDIPALDIDLVLELPGRAECAGRGEHPDVDDMAEARRSLARNLKFTKAIDEEFGTLLDTGKLATVTVTLNASTACPEYVQELHSCLDDALCAAFPVVFNKGHLRPIARLCPCLTILRRRLEYHIYSRRC